MLRGVVVSFIQGRGGKRRCTVYNACRIAHQDSYHKCGVGDTSDHAACICIRKKKRERRASARPGGSSVSPPRRSLLVLSVASPSKSGTIPRSTSSQLTCLSLSAALCGSFPTLFFFRRVRITGNFFQQHLHLGNPVTAIWSVRCVAHKNYS